MMKNEKSKVTRKPISTFEPDSKTLTNFTKTNHIIEMSVVENLPFGLKQSKRISKTEYLNTKTGEICKYKKSADTKSRNLNRTFTKLKQLINNNFTCKNSELHITLTYNYNVDYHKIPADFKHFRYKLKYQYPNLEYIAIYEPQHTGRWHIHILLKDKREKNLFIPFQQIQHFWEHGRIHVNKIRGNDNIGVYFTAMLSNLDILEDNSISKSCSQKYILKKGRLAYYPKDFKIYSVSKGIKRPEKKKLPYSEAMQLIEDQPIVYDQSYEILLEDSNSKRVINTIRRIETNAKRKNKHN